MSLVLLNFPTSFDSENRKPSIGRMTGPLSAGSFWAGEEGFFLFCFVFSFRAAPWAQCRWERCRGVFLDILSGIGPWSCQISGGILKGFNHSIECGCVMEALSLGCFINGESFFLPFHEAIPLHFPALQALCLDSGILPSETDNYSHGCLIFLVANS